MTRTRHVVVKAKSLLRMRYHIFLNVIVEGGASLTVHPCSEFDDCDDSAVLVYDADSREGCKPVFIPLETGDRRRFGWMEKKMIFHEAAELMEYLMSEPGCQPIAALVAGRL